MAKDRSSFPPVFWVANFIEILERCAYYGIYFGFGIYMTQMGYSRDQLGIVQSLFLLVSYTVPVLSGTFADKFGFKKVLIVSYLAYLPTILLLVVTKTFSGIVISMLMIGFAAGMFKPLIAGTVRMVSDSTNKTLGFGIFYMMVNIGGSLGPIIAGNLRAMSWDYVFYASGCYILLMLLITIFFYKEPPREPDGVTLGEKLKEIGTVLSDVKFSVFLIMLGVFFWLPFWAFFNICALYVDSDLDTASLYQALAAIPLIGAWIADALSQDVDGTRRIMGETISHTGWIIIMLQLVVTKVVEKYKAMPAFMWGLVISAFGFVFMGLALVSAAWLVFVGIILFAIGEMVSSPRIQEYITWIAPKEKAGLYMGTNFLAVAIGGLTSGVYTWAYGAVRDMNHPEYIWYILTGHLILAVFAFWIFIKVGGSFKEQQE